MSRNVSRSIKGEGRVIGVKILPEKIKAHDHLFALQARFQQKQLQEKEQKLLQLYDQQQQRAHQVAQRGSAGSNGSNGSSQGSAINSTAGKVRQIFDERRQTNVKGIDKSYPLEPLDGKSKKHSNSTVKPSVAGVNSKLGQNAATRRTMAGTKRTNKTDANSNVQTTGSRGGLAINRRESFARESYTSSRDSQETMSQQRENVSRESYAFGAEIHGEFGESIRQANGNARNGQRYEINIDDVIDNEAMERNRMLAKFHPVEIDRQRRFSNDIENEEFPEEMLHDVTDKVAEKPSSLQNAARKSSLQAEPRVERFKNTNTRKSNGNATTTTTTTTTPTTMSTTKKPTIPTGSNASTRATTTRNSNGELLAKKGDSSSKGVGDSVLRKNVSPYPSSKSPDNTSEQKSRPAAKAFSLKLGSRTTGSNGDIPAASENGFSIATRKPSLTAVDYPDSPEDSRNRSTDDERPSTMAPAPRTGTTFGSTSSIGTNRSQASTTARNRPNPPKTKAPTPARRLSTQAAALTNDDSLTLCKICNRRFTEERITLHEQICAKTSQKKRKQFDTVTHRVRGTELESFVHKPVTKKQSRTPKPEPEPKQQPPKSNWRRKHEDFINAIRSAKQAQAHLAAGGKLSDLPPPPPSDTSDYIQCPHCSRKFNEAAAQRHVPKCQTMQHNKPNPRAPPKPKR